MLSIIAANYTEPGSVRVTTTAASYVGRGTGEPDDEVRRVAALLSEAAPMVAIANFRGAQWTKLVVNMLNAVPAIVGRSVQDVVDDPALRRVVAASMRETVRVGAARGIRFGSLQGLGDRRLRLFARLPLWAAQVLPWSMRVRHRSSTPTKSVLPRPNSIVAMRGRGPNLALSSAGSSDSASTFAIVFARSAG